MNSCHGPWNTVALVRLGQVQLSKERAMHACTGDPNDLKRDRLRTSYKGSQSPLVGKGVEEDHKKYSGYLCERSLFV